MKTYIFTYSTNYNMGMVVITAESLEKAKILAKEAGAWDTNNVLIVDNPTKEEILFRNSDANNY